MTPLEKLDFEIKNARRVVWPANQNDVVNKLVFCLAQHVKELYALIENLQDKINEDKEEDTSKCTAACTATNSDTGCEEAKDGEEEKAKKDRPEISISPEVKAPKRKALKRKKKKKCSTQ